MLFCHLRLQTVKRAKRIPLNTEAIENKNSIVYLEVTDISLF